MKESMMMVVVVTAMVVTCAAFVAAITQIALILDKVVL